MFHSWHTRLVSPPWFAVSFICFSLCVVVTRTIIIVEFFVNHQQSAIVIHHPSSSLGLWFASSSSTFYSLDVNIVHCLLLSVSVVPSISIRFFFPSHLFTFHPWLRFTTAPINNFSILFLGGGSSSFVLHCHYSRSYLVTRLHVHVTCFFSPSLRNCT